MAARRKSSGAAPLPISALPLPADDSPTQNETPAASLPTNKEGKLSPAQRARLGLDVYGDDQPVQNGNATNGSAPAAPPPSAPAEPRPARPAEPAPSNFGFTEINPFEQSQEPEAAPRLDPAGDAPKLAPATPAAVHVNRRKEEDGTDNSATRATTREIRHRDADDRPEGYEAIERDRNVFTYGVAWTIFTLMVTMAISFTNTFTQGSGQAPGPGPFIPALLSVLLGWVIVFAARGMGKNWVWLMAIPAAVLVIGPYLYSMWWIKSVEQSGRDYLSTAALSSQIDVDQKSIVSQTINTSQGCFALTRDRETGDTRIDVVTYAPSTAQQQATMAMAARYARRVQAGGAQSTQRAFTLAGGTAPVVVEELLTPPIDCERSVTVVTPG